MLTVSQPIFMTALRSFYLSIALFTLVCFTPQSQAQILNADRYGDGVDSSKTFRGIFDIGFTLQKQTNLLFSLRTRLDLSYYHKKSLWVLIGNFKLFRSGSTNILNGGFAHARVRFAKDHWIHPECFAQYQQDGILGMENRILGGANLRFIIKEYDKGRLHYGLGAMYEFERWNYSGVPSSIVIPDRSPVDRHYIKLNTYFSITQEFFKIVHLQLTLYYQARPDRFIINPRIALNGNLTIKFSKHISFSVRYNVFYDALPVVPIEPLYFSFVNQLRFEF